jgi:glycosyltransferase involved in cell wall biosynthesis
MPVISIVIPAYNAERTILETIASVRQQTFTDFELIVINDGSTDRTLDLLRTIEDDRLKVFSYSNGGLATARNRGICKSTGEFIAFLDADDLWANDKLELQLAALKAHPNAGLAYSWTYNMSEAGKLLYPVEPTFSGAVYTDLLLWNFLSNGSNPLIRRQTIESVGEFRSPGTSADWDYWLRVAVKWNFILVPKHLVFYRHCANSMSTKLDIMKADILITIDRTFAEAPVEFQYLKKRCLAITYQYYAEVYLRNINPNQNSSQIDRVISNLWQGIFLSPASILDRYTQSMIIKIFTIKILTPKNASRLFQFIKRFKAGKNSDEMKPTEPII